VVAAGRCPPVDLPLRDDLRTRLGWGHVFELHALGEPEARAVLRREADRRGLLLSDEVMSYLMTRHARDLKSLMALLLELDTFGLAAGRPVTLPLLRRLLAEQELPA
jgi:DnaA family protein